MASEDGWLKSRIIGETKSIVVKKEEGSGDVSKSWDDMDMSGIDVGHGCIISRKCGVNRGKRREVGSEGGGVSDPKTGPVIVVVVGMRGGDGDFVLF